MPKSASKIYILVLLIALIAVLSACTLTTDSNNPFENEQKEEWLSDYTKDQAIELSTSAISNLKKHLDSDTVSETGYFVQFDMNFDSDDGSNFILKFKANLFTHPYFKTDADGNIIVGEDGKPVVDEEKLAIHNEIIKKNDLIIEWFDGHTNKLLLGLYFDGKNSSLGDPGNNLYLNLRGESRRMFKNFGDSETYRQLVRLITSINIDKMFGDGGVDGSVNTLKTYLTYAITNNYKVTKNGDVTSTFYNNVLFDVIHQDITNIIQDLFGPFGNKLDPLTSYYLGFKFSTLGGADVQTLSADLRFLSETQENGVGEVLSGAEIKASGTALVRNQLVPFRTDAAFSYSARVKSDIKVSDYIDRTEYKEYLYGQYEYAGELYVPMMAEQGMISRMDAVVRTKLTSDVDKNDENRIQMSFTDKANGSRLLLGAYYCNERTYLNTTGLQDLYGGIKINEIGFPRAYIEGPNIAQLLTDLYATIDSVITDFVDGVISGTGSSVLFDEIMKKMTSNDTDGTISIRVDLELIKIVLRETQEGNPDYSTQDIIDMLSDSMGYDLEEIAFMLGITDAKRMLEKTWFDLTYTVHTSAIRIEMSSNAMNENVTSLIFRLDLNPVKIGEKVTFPEGFDDWFGEYKQLQEVKTISASVNGTVSFSNSAAVDISDLLGAMVGDRSGLNTRYFLPASSSLGFSLVFDQYVKFDDYDDDVYPGDDWEDQIGEMRGRIGFKLQVWENRSAGGSIPILNVYAKDVAFNTDCEEDKLGYVWVDIAATGFTKVKIREDVFLDSLTDYMGGNSAAGEAMALSIPQIIAALLEDSNSIDFLPDVIQLSTSNKTIQKLFGVKAVLLTADIAVGLTPRVTGLTQIEGQFADYTVGTLADMTGDDHYSTGVYEKNLYDTIGVTFTRDGLTWTENLRVPFYRVPEPGDPADYETKEEYDAAVKKYNDYLSSKHSLQVIDGKTMYYPSTNGNFMGQFRSYTVEIRKTGGASLTSVTSKVTKLDSNNLVWEPLEAEPTTVLGTISNGRITVPASYSIDFASVTIDGLPKTLYTVTVGPGSIGEVQFPCYITVRNRRITKEDGSVSDLANVYTAVGAASKAPVAAQISIDPYDFIIWRGEYLGLFGREPENSIGQYLKDRSELKSVIFRFGDGISERVELTWEFDPLGSGGLNGEKYISAEGGNSLYAHAYFHNQLVALRINVLPKILDYVVFDGETEHNVYTVDVLNSVSKTIPKRPTVYFTDGTSRKFPFDFEWAFPVADNVTLSGSAMVDGVESPFLGHIGKDDVAWLSMSKVYGELNGWFADVLVSITVNAPAKNIENVYQVENPTLAAENATGGVYFARDVMLDGGTLRGYWVIDPYQSSSKFLPAALTAYFVDANGVRTERHYGADVVAFHDGGKGLLVKENGKYRFNAGEHGDKTKVRTFVLRCSISEEFKFDFIVAVLPEFDAVNDTVIFFDKNGIEIGASVISKDPVDYSLYNYTLSPFPGLALPNMFEIRSAIDGRFIGLTPTDGGSEEAYYVRHTVKPAKRGNYELQYQYVMQGDSRFAVYLKLLPTYSRDNIESIVLKNGTTIGKAEIASLFNFETFPLDAQGFVLDNEGQQLVVDGKAIKLSDYIRYLFSEVTVKLNDGNDFYYSPTIVGFDKFDVQATLSQGGAAFNVSFSGIENYINVNVVIRSTGLETIKSGNVQALSVQPFTADGKENYPDGYSLYSQEFEITYDGKPSVAFRSDRWTVSQVTNLKGNLLPVGALVSVISPEVLRGERENEEDVVQIIFYAFLGDSSKVTLTVRIAPLNMGAFESATSETLPIVIDKNSDDRKYSLVKIANMYEKRQYLVDEGALISHLPTTVKIGGTQIDNIRWIADGGLNDHLKALRYDVLTEFKLASATVEIGTGGNPYTITLQLYIRFEKAVLDNVKVDAESGDKTGVYYEQNNGTGAGKIVTIRIKPYQTPVGTVSYVFPTSFKAKFVAGAGEYVLNWKVLYNTASFQEALPFDYNGTTYRGLQGADTKNEMTFALDLGFGQQIKVVVKFVDQTVGTLASADGDVSDVWFGKVVNGVYDIAQVDRSSDKVPSNFVIDPYGAKYRIQSGVDAHGVAIYTNTYIPTLVKINDSQSAAGAYKVSDLYVLWGEYAVTFSGLGKTTLKGKIVREGFTTQTVTIKFSVKDRSALQENVIFRDESFAGGDVTVAMRSTGIPVAHIRNPFTFRFRNDLPKTIKSVTYANGDSGADVPIFWEMTDLDVDYSGNNMSTKAVRYRLNDATGQQFTFFLAMDKWDYVALERQVAGNWQEMNPIYFLISSVSGMSDLTEFRIQFRVTDAEGKLNPYNRTQIFYSETSREATVDKREPILYFDKAAIELAQTTGGEVQGVFSLGAENKLKYEVQKSMASVWYSSAKPSITDTYFYYRVLTTDYYSPFVLIDPLNPVWPGELYAYVNWTSERVSLKISDEGNPFEIDTLKYINRGGGVILGRSVYVEYTDKASGERITFKHKIDILFLDRRQSAPISVASAAELPTSYTLNSRDNYGKNTYSGMSNPYSDSYDSATPYLNAAIRIYGASTDITNIVWDTATKTSVSMKIGGRTYGSLTEPCSLLSYVIRTV